MFPLHSQLFLELECFPYQLDRYVPLSLLKLIHVSAAELHFFFVTQPFGGLPMMPIQAMTQQVCYFSHGYIDTILQVLYVLTCIRLMHLQATRHARRVYVGGLSPSANEQV